MTPIDEIVDALTEADSRLADGDDPSRVRPLVRQALAGARRIRQQRGGSADNEEAEGIEGPLGRVLRDRCLEIGSNAGCRVEVGLGGHPPLGDRAQEVIVEAAEMLVAAFAEHGADKIAVTLSGADDVVLHVGDEGTAFDAAQVGPADLKLRELRSLVQAVDGQVVWESSWREGTTLEVSVPAA